MGERAHRFGMNDAEYAEVLARAAATEIDPGGIGNPGNIASGCRPKGGTSWPRDSPHSGLETTWTKGVGAGLRGCGP